METKKIKILHIISEFRFGGIQRLVYDLVSTQLQNNDILPEILVLDNKGEFKQEFEELNIHIHPINPLRTYLFKPNQLSKVMKCFKSNDIIHFHGFHLYLGLLALLSKTKIIYTEHGNFAFGRKKKISDYIVHILRRYYYKWVVDVVACNSRFTKEYLKNKWCLQGKHIKVVLNGSNTNLKCNDKTVNDIKVSFQNNFIIGTTSRLAGFKRIDRLIEAFEIFASNKQDVKLVIVGDGIEKNSLQNIAIEKNLSNVFFTGFKSNVFDYQSAFDICVFPSQNEPFGLVAVEAYSAHKPVLVFEDGGGLMEIVSRCNSDDIVGSIEAMAKRMDYYYKTKTNKKNITKLLNYFSMQRMERDYFKEYKEMLCAELVE